MKFLPICMLLGLTFPLGAMRKSSSTGSNSLVILQPDQNDLERPTSVASRDSKTQTTSALASVSPKFVARRRSIAEGENKSLMSGPLPVVTLHVPTDDLIVLRPPVSFAEPVYSPNRQYYITQGKNKSSTTHQGIVRLWQNGTKPVAVAELHKHSETPDPLLLLNDQRLIVAPQGDQLKLYNTQPNGSQPAFTFLGMYDLACNHNQPTKTSMVVALAASQCGHRVVTCDTKNTVRLWDISTTEAARDQKFQHNPANQPMPLAQVLCTDSVSVVSFPSMQNNQFITRGTSGDLYWTYNEETKTLSSDTVKPQE